MPALSLNGIGVSVVSGEHETTDIGDTTRAFSGSLIKSIRTEKEVWQFATPPLTQFEAQATRGLVRGLGHSFSFDADLYSDGKGLGPSTSTGCTAQATKKKYGANALKIANTNSVIGYTPGFYASTSAYPVTIAFWKIHGAAWRHYIRTMTAAGSASYYLNGSPFTYVETNNFGSYYEFSTLNISAGEYRLDFVLGTRANTTAYSQGNVVRNTANTGLFYCNTAGTTAGSQPAGLTTPVIDATTTDGSVQWVCFNDDGHHYLDDLQILPYAVSASWAAQMYTEANTRAMTALPSLRMTGSLVTDVAPDTAAITVQGEVEKGRMAQFMSGGTWQSAGEVLPFTLAEV